MRNMAVLHSPAFSYPLPVLVRVLSNLLIFKGKILYYNKYNDTNEDNYNVTILIAEDEESNFLLLKTILKRHCNVLQARTGLELLKVFAEKGADLILLDIKMPEMNGIEALKEIRKKDTNIPIIMQSAYAFENDMEAARAAGSNGFITKPINIVELKKTISKFLPQIIW